MKKINKIIMGVLGVIFLTGCTSNNLVENNTIECGKEFKDMNNLTIGVYDCDKLVCKNINYCKIN